MLNYGYSLLCRTAFVFYGHVFHSQQWKHSEVFILGLNGHQKRISGIFSKSGFATINTKEFSQKCDSGQFQEPNQSL